MKDKLTELLSKLDVAYKLSDSIKNKNADKWGYSLIQSALVEKQPLFIGFNWGVDNSWLNKGNKYGIQNTIKKEIFSDLSKGSIERAVKWGRFIFVKPIFQMVLRFIAYHIQTLK